MHENVEIRWDPVWPSSYGHIYHGDDCIGTVDREGPDWIILLRPQQRTVTIKVEDNALPVRNTELLAAIRAHAVAGPAAESHHPSGA